MALRSGACLFLTQRPSSPIPLVGRLDLVFWRLSPGLNNPSAFLHLPLLLLLSHRSFPPVENLTGNPNLNALHLFLSCAMAHVPHIHHLHTGFTFSTSMWWTETRAGSSPGIPRPSASHMVGFTSSVP